MDQYSCPEGIVSTVTIHGLAWKKRSALLPEVGYMRYASDSAVNLEASHNSIAFP